MAADTALDKVRVVLSHTSHPGNIGAAARAMKTMGLTRLYLVRPRSFPHPDADAFASRAADVLSGATVCDTLQEALRGTVLAVASTSRRRDLAHELVDCRTACGYLVAESVHGDVAVVFGTERIGLTAGEVSRCRLTAAIPASAEYASLNLAQAVQVFAYELRMAVLEPVLDQAPAPQPAEHEQAEGFFQQLEQAFYDTGFLDPRQPRRLMQRMRRLFARARLEKEEVNILRGFLRAVRKQ
jgi:tRNA/rRNA methyltransferase